MFKTFQGAYIPTKLVHGVCVSHSKLKKKKPCGRNFCHLSAWLSLFCKSHPNGSHMYKDIGTPVQDYLKSPFFPPPPLFFFIQDSFCLCLIPGVRCTRTSRLNKKNFTAYTKGSTLHWPSTSGSQTHRGHYFTSVG